MTKRRPAEWIRDLQRATAEPVRVQLSPDFFVEFPVEVFVETGPGYVPGSRSDWDEWRRQGDQLLERLRQALGVDFDVRWAGDFSTP